jgi:hypothetical protein
MRYFISVCSIFILTFLLPFARTAQAAENGDTLTCEQLDSLALSPLWTDHMTFSKYTAIFPIYDTCWAVESIVRFMDSEANNPSSIGRYNGTHITYSQFMIRQGIKTLEALGPGIIPTLYGEKSEYNLKTQSLISIVLTILRDESVHSEIRDLMLKHPDPLIRSSAAMVIGAYKDTLDIPLLLDAMEDTFSVIVYLDYMLPGHSMSETVHPVAWDAFKTLIEAFGVIPDSKAPKGYRPYKKGN